MIDKGYLLGERYRIIDVLGEGGMANVYLAEDIILQRKVAVKVLRLDLRKEPQTESRFQREALATSELSHPNIVSVLDVGTDQGLPYMVMEYVDGPDLKDYIKDNSPLSLDEVVRIMDQILSAIALAHKHNVIHRDLKPQNILMDKRGNVKIADFGIAVALNQSSITQTNSIMGSVHYMSPEQTRGGLVTRQSDIYSLGIILYELITGHVPFNGETPVAIALKHAQEPIPSIRERDPKVPQALENVVLRATAKDPRDRYESAQAMEEDLNTALDPSRANEPVFEPDYGYNDDKTIVLPDFNKNQNDQKSVDNSAEVSEENKVPFWQSVKKHWLWFVFIGIATMLIVVIMGYAFTGRNNKLVRVPDVTNLSEGSAKTKLEKVGLITGKVTHKESDSIDAGKVISTNPSAGDAVKKGKVVSIVVSSGAGMVKVPDVMDKDYETAATQLEKMGFNVVRESQYSMTVDEGHVISQSIAAGVEVKPSQTTITLVVSEGKEPKPDKPTIKLADLTNDTLEHAQSYAKDNDLTLQINQEFSDTVKKGNIISMRPEAGTKIEKGSTITIVVSKGKEEGDSEVTKSFTVTYDPSETTDDGEEATNNHANQGNHVQIYIEDDSHSLSNIYRDMYIKSDTNFSIPFSLKDGNGRLKVVRDGQTILNEKVTK